MFKKERYFDSLDDAGRQRYLDKLFLLSLSVENDTYTAINSKTFVRDWPPVEFGHILCFLLIALEYMRVTKCCNGGDRTPRTSLQVGFIDPLKFRDLNNTQVCQIDRNLLSIQAHKAHCAWVAVQYTRHCMWLGKNPIIQRSLCLDPSYHVHARLTSTMLGSNHTRLTVLGSNHTRLTVLGSNHTRLTVDYELGAGA